MSHFDTLITVDELNARLDDPGLRIVDCRFSLADPEAGREMYEAGHLPGAVYADLDRDLAAPVTETTGRHPLPDAEALIASLRRWGIDTTSQV
ncbi:MAG: rhodanese-like domain-containing protein, partial [Pseudomonadota bacterium]